MATPSPQAKARDRVRLIHCTDPHTTLNPGALGTVTLVDRLGTVHVQWDNGIQLRLVPSEDTFAIIDTQR